MALQFRYQPREMGPVVETVTVDRHWYLTEDKSHVVEEGHPDGRSLWATPGMEVPRADAERLGAVTPKQAAVEPEPEPEPAEETKATPKPGDKQQRKGTDKGHSVADLRAHAAGLGVAVDNRWGIDRLQHEIAKAEGSR